MKKYLEGLTENRTSLAVLFIVLLGFLLRVHHLGTPSLWYDETCTFCRIHGTFSYPLSTLRVSPFPPLYYFMLNVWAKIFGYSEAALRFPSLLFSTLSIVFIFLLCKELFNRSIGVIAAFLLSISPYAINYAQEAKQYAMIWFLSILTFYFFIRYVRSEKTSHLVCYILASVAGIYTLYMGFLFLFVQNVLFFTFFKGKDIRRWLAGQGAIILLYLPWVFQTIFTVKNISGIKWIKHPESYLATFVKTFRLCIGDFKIFGRGDLQKIEIFLFVFLMFVTGVYFLFSCFTRHTVGLIKRKEIGLVIIWWLLPVFLYLLIDRYYTPIFLERYLGYSHIPILLLVSIGIFIINFFIKRSQYIILSLLLVFTVYGQLLPYYKNSLKRQNCDWRGIIQELCSRTTDGSLVVLGSHAERPVLYYGRCLKGMIRTTPLFDVGPEHDAILILNEGGRYFLEERIIRQQGFVLRETMNKDSVGFVRFEPLCRQPRENNDHVAKHKFVQQVKEKCNQGDLLLVNSLSEFPLQDEKNFIVDFNRFRNEYGSDKKYYKKHESIFLLYKDTLENMKSFVPVGYLLKEQYVLSLPNGGEIGYFWYKRIQ